MTEPSGQKKSINNSGELTIKLDQPSSRVSYQFYCKRPSTNPIYNLELTSGFVAESASSKDVAPEIIFEPNKNGEDKVQKGTSPTGYWQTRWADFCLPSGDLGRYLNSPLALNATQTYGPLNEVTAKNNPLKMTLKCNNTNSKGELKTREVSGKITVIENAVVSLLGRKSGEANWSDNTLSVPKGSKIDLKWETANMTRCSAQSFSPEWDGAKNTNGQQDGISVPASGTYILTCNNTDDQFGQDKVMVTVQ